jgi:hypothetical protein
MEKSETKSCAMDGRIYSDDAEVCAEGRCMICRDGDWQETQDLFPPKKSGILAP